MRSELFIPKHKTNILPLRWLANYIFHPISMIFFHIGLRAYDQIYESGEGYTIWDELKEIIGHRIYKFLDYPYAWWGTTYVLDQEVLSAFKQEVGDWDDYDAQGHPYWDYLWNVDEETGDGWRLVSKV